MTMARFTVSPDEHESRLDHVLGRILPGTGLRGRRRLCELSLALVNGRPAPASRKVREGDIVEIPDSETARYPVSGREKHDGPESFSVLPSNALFPEDAVRLILRSPHLAALYKPAGMHTEALAGKPGISLQTLLTGIPGLGNGARLLNRLDFPTSGLTLAALDDEGENLYRQAQEEGRTEKRYLAVLEGSLTRGVLAVQRLSGRNRARMTVETTPHPDPGRHTSIQPLIVMDASETMRKLGLKEHGWQGSLPSGMTLAGCIILKGARHQIRAHGSSLGHPLLGDRRYGASLIPADGSDEAFFLHHGRLILPGFDAAVLPPWLEVLGKDAVRAAERWLNAPQPEK